jgi:hypothetical protein
MIKSIIINSALKSVKSNNNENVLEKTIKSGNKNELIKSICNTSGIFLKEFREIQDDPYAREEFIMSIH